MKQFSFPKSKRLVKNKQFKDVLANKTCASDELLMVYSVKNDCGLTRLGVSIGKSCGGAVTRNRLKRLIREAFRLNQHQLPSGVDYMVMISPQWLKVEQDGKKAVKELKLDQVTNSLLSLAVKAVRKIT